MPRSIRRRSSDIASMSSLYRDSPRETDPRSSHFSGYLFGDPDLDPPPRSDPEAESVRSHPSSHAAEQSLLPRAPTTPARAQTQRLQRRRNQYYYSNGLLYPVPAGASTKQQQQQQHQHQHPTEPGPGAGPADTHQQNAPSKRAKPYLTASGSAPGWLLSSTGAFADAKRQSWTGERRESRKLQKDHPVGSARPTCTVEIPADDAAPGDVAAAAGERDAGGRGSVLGVRRRMEKLRGLYRRGDKEGMASSNVR